MEDIKVMKIECTSIFQKAGIIRAVVESQSGCPFALDERVSCTDDSKCAKCMERYVEWIIKEQEEW